jgi:hypothetical protein
MEGGTDPKAEWVLDGVVTMPVGSDVMQRRVDGRFCRSYIVS